MALLESFMDVYRHVAHPGVVLVGCSLLFVVHNSVTSGTSRHVVGVRLGALLGVETVSLAPTALYVLVTGQSVQALTLGNDWCGPAHRLVALAGRSTPAGGLGPLRLGDGDA